jgi:hypothetical protein
VVLEEAQRIEDPVLDHDGLARVLRARDPDLQLAVLPEAARLPAQRVASRVGDLLDLEQQREVETLRRPVLDGDRAVEALPRTEKFTSIVSLTSMVASSDTRMSASKRSMSSVRAAAGDAKASAAANVRAASQGTRRMRRSGGGRGEADLRRLALGAGELEELARLETEGARDDAVGELRDLRVQVAAHGVVVPPRVPDLVLDLLQRTLQRGESLDRPQLRIGLGQREKALERAAEPPSASAFAPGPWAATARLRAAITASSVERSCPA